MIYKLEKHNRAIVIADCVWHGWPSHSKWIGIWLTPTIRFDYLKDGCWTLDIIWLKLWITFGYVRIHY